MKLSVVTVCLNCRDDLKKTLDSVLTQTQLTGVEVLVIDGGSCDGTLDYLSQLDNEFVKWTSEEDTGIFNAMNKGLKLAQGEWCIFLNAGDSFSNERIVARFDSELNTEADVVFGNAQRIAREGFKRWKSNENVDGLWKGMIFCHQAAFYRTSLVKEHNFDERYCLAGDFDQIFKIYRGGANFKKIAEDVALIDNQGVSNTKKVESTLERFYIVYAWNSTFKVFSYYVYLLLRSFLSESFSRAYKAMFVGTE